ncbi:Glycosyl transferase family 1 [Penicillium malachiteum]|nr:Glycosyl transferase family 1 [Penicillium malachiteum]
MPKVYPVHPLDWDEMTSHWWQFLKPHSETISLQVSQQLANLGALQLNLNAVRSENHKPSSFGVYLGGLENPLTASQKQLLNQWDLLVVDPLQNGVPEATSAHKNRLVLGRLDLAQLASPKHSDLAIIESIQTCLIQKFCNTAFSGVLLASWEDALSSTVQQQLFQALSSLQLDVYLETQPPYFLQNRHVLSSAAITGLVIRNASILPHGEKRDYFQMPKLQPTIKAFVSEACTRDFVVGAWETVNEDVTIPNAVVRRSLQWCNFYGILPWIGTDSALYNSELNTPIIEPLSAFGWLGEAKIMDVHESWRSNLKISAVCDQNIGWETLLSVFPSIKSHLQSTGSEPKSSEEAKFNLPGHPEWVARIKSQGNPLSVTMTGRNHTQSGCVPLDSESNEIAFSKVLKSQQRLRDLKLLHSVPSQEIEKIGKCLQSFQLTIIHDPDVSAIIEELSDFALHGSLYVYLSLDSGLRQNKNHRFWAVSQLRNDGAEIFVSKNAQDLAGTVLHTFLSTRGISRQFCYQTETDFARWSKSLAPGTTLPRRLVQDIDALSPQEGLKLLQDLSLNDVKDDISGQIRSLVRTKLIDAASATQLKEVDTTGFLEQSISPEILVRNRINWYEEQQCTHPSFDTSLDLFNEVHRIFNEILRDGREDDLAKVSEGLSQLLQDSNIDAYTDMAALALICAARKSAFDEIYTEVTDRNPLFNNQSDQAAALAESFALGSRCEAYFAVSPSVFGKLLFNRFRAYYSVHQPPSWVNGAPELATAYAGAQIDIDPDEKAKPMRPYQRFTLMSVFAIPALIDVLLASFIGRGLYLSAFMSIEEQGSATMALMISLLLSGAIGTWILIGGHYYLISMAFSAANMFVLIRLVAGIAATLAGGLIGFITISTTSSPRAGIVFYLYLVSLTIYFCTFSALATFSYPGSAFLSGRKAIILCIPLLFLSPIITTFTEYDSVVYICVLYALAGLLLFCLRSTLSRWMTWYQFIRYTDDAEIRQWYISAHGDGNEKAFAMMSDPAVLKLSREALLQDIHQEISRGFCSKKTNDQLVKELARDWTSTNFLLDWYCRYADVSRPIPFSSSWNIQTKVALDTLRNSEKGLRLHNAFIHWRQSINEIGCGILYFVLALLDKWIQLFCGDNLLGLIGAVTDSNRMAVGLSMAYYLIGVVLIDTKAQKVQDALGKQEPIGIKTEESIRVVEKGFVRFRRGVYRRMLSKFLLWHVWSLAVATALLWSSTSTKDDIVIFFAHVIAYTGLLWYQYNTIYAGPYALKPAISGICAGLPVGIALKVCRPGFLYSSVIGLGVAAWTAALLSLWNAGMAMPSKSVSPLSLDRTFHALTAPWSDPKWSQQELQNSFDRIFHLSSHDRIGIHPATHPALEIKAMLQSHTKDPEIGEAFPNVKDIIYMVTSLWDQEGIRVELVPFGSLGPSIQALSCNTGDRLIVLVGIRDLHSQRLDIPTCRIIAEALIHTVAEMKMGMSHEHAILTGMILSGGITRGMATEPDEADTSVALQWAKKELIRQLCLGHDPDIHWEKLPVFIRRMLLGRCLGQQVGLSEAHWDWLERNACQSDAVGLNTHIARCNLGVTVALGVLDYCQSGKGATVAKRVTEYPESISYIPRTLPLQLSVVHTPFSLVYHKLGTIVKFVVIALLADAEFQRELDFVAKSLPMIIRGPTSILLHVAWNYAKLCQDFCLPLFLFHGRKNVKKLWDETKGVSINLESSRIVVRNLKGTFTAFKHPDCDGRFKVYQYAGDHTVEPTETKELKCISEFSSDMFLITKQEFNASKLLSEYHYDYTTPLKKHRSLGSPMTKRIPLGRRCVHGQNHLSSVQYNSKGLIDTGSYMKDGSLVRFKYHYRDRPGFEDEIIRAEFVLPHIACAVSWCAPPKRHLEKPDQWIPHSKVTEATFIQGVNVFISCWKYDHKFHPTINTTLNGKSVQTPPMIEHDLLGVLAKPKYTNFIHDNPLLSYDHLKFSSVAHLLGLTKKRFTVSSSSARSLIWRAWKDCNDLDGITVRWMDDRILRRDEVLTSYWRRRDWGNLPAAKKYMDLHVDAIMASADLDDDVSGWTPLAVKLSDLFNFGPGGDAVVTTCSRDISPDTDNALHVMAADTGTWPNEGGGVSACRRDMVNSLRTIKWHMLCESANDFGIPKHQTERNIQSLKIIPLWGLDFLTPTHGLLHNKLDAEVNNATTSSELDIKMNFIPILTALVKAARAVHISKADIQQATRALVNLNTYFRESRHWSQIWTSEFVKQAWRDLWLSEEMPNSIPSTEWLDTELPTLTSLNVALELWYRYLFIFSIPVPEKIPDVFQASHHSVSASYGVVCKMKRGCTLQIWDHAISWRETNICLSSALCKLSPFVRNSLLGLMRITSVLSLHHADVILPCADFFNPGWETEIGTCQGTLEHRNTFLRKVDPVVNGITDMQKFTPVEKITSQRPTVTMLSHVWYAKDIKTALLAADIIINQWKFDDYHLEIYGAIDKAPTYSTECQEIIASKGLRGRVTLRGTADPMKVLEKTWVFLNSSLSEGLPLALGEAALTGAPVVCTDVGASLRVLSDPDDFSRFSAVVPPNDALSLAKAQISMLAMLGEWSQYADDSEPAPILTSSPTPEDVSKITRRMYEKSQQRRDLGMRARQIVQRSFSGERYLREHEQMLWIGKFTKMMSDSDAGARTELASRLDLDMAHQEATTVSTKAVYPRRLSSTTLRLNSFSVGRELPHGLRREDLVQYSNSDVSLIMSQDVLRSGMLWSG